MAKTKYEATKTLKTFRQDITIFIDTREKKKDHVTFFLERKNIKYEIKKLDTGDYSFIYKGKDYRNIFSIDRKQHVDELIGNLCEKRFLRELDRATKIKNFSFVIEHGHLGQIFKGEYRSMMNKKSAIAMIETWKCRGINFEFINGVGFSQYLTTKIYYFIRNELLKQSN